MAKRFSEDYLRPFACALVALALSTAAFSQEPPSSEGNSETTARIRDEGLTNSQAMEILSYLTEVIGPRLTASPNLKRANEWTRDKMRSWGLANAHLEEWGPFGRGWSLRRFSAQVVEPQAFPLTAVPSAWSPGLGRPLTAEVVYLDAPTTADLDKYKGKLKGAIVLSGRVRELQPRFEPLATRLAETNLLRLANAPTPRSSARRGSPSAGPGRGGPGPRSEFQPPERRDEQVSGSTNISRPTPPPSRGMPPGRGRSGPRPLSFLAAEGAALVVSPSPMGDGGTVFVGTASVPLPEPQGTNRFNFANSPRAWSTNVPAVPPQITVAAEDFNRLVRMIQRGEKPKMAVDLEVEFHADDSMCYNTIAEIPGTDLKDEIVMVGGHLDSVQGGTGATDNAVGVAAAMEAVRIIKHLNLQPRRTIRVGLWAGEEQGFLGSRAYVSRHFGYYTNTTSPRPLRAPKDEDGAKEDGKSSATNAPPERKLVRQHEYEKLSAYFNLDNGGGKIRGIYLQGNEAVRPLFRRWLEPFRDLGAETVTSSNTGGTDHIPFDAIGLPGFQFIQDPLDYMSRTHHSNADVLDRIQADDVKQAATIIASFVYNAAMLEERLPRKPLEERPMMPF